MTVEQIDNMIRFEKSMIENQRSRSNQGESERIIIDLSMRELSILYELRKKQVQKDRMREMIFKISNKRRRTHENNNRNSQRSQSN